MIDDLDVTGPSPGRSKRSVARMKYDDSKLSRFYIYVTTHDPDLGPPDFLALNPYLNMARQIPIEYVTEAL
jgi:hypothetical protein